MLGLQAAAFTRYSPASYVNFFKNTNRCPLCFTDSDDEFPESELQLTPRSESLNRRCLTS